MGWFDGLGRRAILRGADPDTADVAARANILASAMEDERRDRDLPPPPVAGWCYHEGAWLRWSELDGAYRAAPMPMALVTFARTLGTPREGMTVALVDGEWREVTDGSAPLREARPETPVHEQMGGVVPRALLHAQPLGPQRIEPTKPTQDQTAQQPTTPPVPEGQTAPPPPPPPPPPPQNQSPEPTMEEQLAAWRQRNAERGS